MLSNLHRFHAAHRFLARCSLLMMTALLATIAFTSTVQSRTNGTYYKVQHGDTLSDIAQFYSLSTWALMDANALSDADHIHSGDRLYIPAQSAQYGYSCRYYHQVGSGQTLSWIAVYYGIDSHSLAEANHVYDYDHIEIGMSLCIPARSHSRIIRPAQQPRSIYRQPPAPATATPYPQPSPTMNPLNYYPEPNGYTYHRVRSNDTFQSLAASYQTTEHHLSVLNPGVAFAPDAIWLVPLYIEIPMPPTAMPRFYPTITPTSTPLIYPTLTPRPPTTTPVPTATRQPTATPIPPIRIEINIAPNITQQGISINSTDRSSGAIVQVYTSTPTAVTTSVGTISPTSTPMPQSTPTPEFIGVVSPWVGQYFVNPSLSGEPFYTNHNSNINFNWGNGGPGYGLPNDKFSARWMAYEELEAGRYTFRAYVEGGFRLYVDGQLLMNKWHDGSGNFLAEMDLDDGYHTIQVDYGKLGSTAHIRVWWTRSLTQEPS